MSNDTRPEYRVTMWFTPDPRGKTTVMTRKYRRLSTVREKIAAANGHAKAGARNSGYLATMIALAEYRDADGQWQPLDNPWPGTR